MKMKGDGSGRASLNAAALSSLFIWASTYNLLCLIYPKNSSEWNCRIVTLIHALISTTLSGYFAFFVNPWVFIDPAGKNNEYENITIVITMGYFLFDLFWCLKHYSGSREESFMLFHHFTSLVNLLYSFISQYSGTETVAVIFGSEVTNPMLQLRWFMRETSMKDTLIYEINDSLFILTFFLVRICVGGYLAYCVLMHPRPPLGIKIGGAAMYLVGCLFMIQIGNYAFKKYTKMYQAGKMKLKSFWGQKQSK